MIRKEDSIKLFHNVYLGTTNGLNETETISKSEVLKIHLMTEVILDNIINVVFRHNVNAINTLKLTYSQKLDMCSNLKLSENNSTLCPDVVESLNRLNSLRNNLALNLNKKITLEEIEVLFVGHLKTKREGHSLNGTKRLILSLYKSMIYINMLNPEKGIPCH